MNGGLIFSVLHFHSDRYEVMSSAEIISELSSSFLSHFNHYSVVNDINNFNSLDSSTIFAWSSLLGDNEIMTADYLTRQPVNDFWPS